MYLGIDFGTSGCRAVVIDEDMTIQAQAAMALPAPHAISGSLRQYPQSWIEALHGVLRRLAIHINLALIKRIAIDGTSGTVLLTNEQGKPLTEALMYNDASSVQSVEQIRLHFPQQTHLTMSATSGLAKALKLCGRVSKSQIRILNQADFISNLMAGQWGVSDYHNALKLGYDAQNLCWPDWVVNLLPAHALPQVLTPGQPFGQISDSLRKRFGFSANCEICAGTTDANAAFIAAGAVKAGTAVTSLGTTMVLKILTAQPVSDLDAGVYSHRFGQRWLVSGASNAGAGILRDHFSDAQIAQLSAQIDINQPSGLDYYPLRSSGERFPVNNPTLEPRITPRPSSDIVFLQGLLEGLSRIEKAGYDKLAQLGAGYPDQVLTCGGGAKNLQWQTLRETMLGIPVTAATHSEACYGSALLAMQSLREADMITSELKPIPRTTND